ncbi:MAG: GTP-binding protein [Candidatus Paceibacterota bacterium]
MAQEKRAPIIAVMGHVDHGKTTLLDHIRKANVADREAGGITQSVGAYEIEHNGQKMTFIDTPGHAAFTGMRSRGANIADLAILVVAADDGVKPQTKEAIDILKKAEIPFIVAINKIDKNNADVDKTKADLAANEIFLEGFGGNISFQPISAKDGTGVSELLDLLLLAAELEDFKTTVDAPATGFVLEAKRDSKIGNSVTLIIKDGSLSKGDLINTPSSTAKIKQLNDFQGKPAQKLSASSPAVVLGFESLPKAGEEFSESTEVKTETKVNVKPPKNAINIILNADLAGTLEALSYSVKQITPPEGKTLHIVQENVGNVTDGDVKLAQSTGALILAFNVKVEKAADFAAKERGTKIISSKIIYEILETLEGYFAHQETGGAGAVLEVLAVFNTSKLEKQIVGGKVVEGVFKNKGKLELRRQGNVVAQGKIINLQKGKDEVESVEAGNECGMLVSFSEEVKEGDKILLQ